MSSKLTQLNVFRIPSSTLENHEGQSLLTAVSLAYGCVQAAPSVMFQRDTAAEDPLLDNDTALHLSSENHAIIWTHMEINWLDYIVVYRFVCNGMIQEAYFVW